MKKPEIAKLIKVMKKLIFLMLMPFLIQAQNFRGLDESPMDQAKYPLSNRVTEKTAIITYSRPQLKNRSFDEIVPKDKVWRTGANEATELRLFNNIEINNTTVVAGTYTVFTIPESGEITFIISLICDVSKAAAILGIKFLPNVFAEQTMCE